MEEERRAAEDKYKYKRRQMRELEEDIEVNIDVPIKFIQLKHNTALKYSFYYKIEINVICSEVQNKHYNFQWANYFTALKNYSN